MENRKYRYKVIEAIAKRFGEAGIHYRVDSDSVVESIEAGFPIRCGPGAFVRYISHSDKNNISVRVLALMTGIPKQKRARIMEVCNYINCEKKYLKYTLSEHGYVNVEYDFPNDCPVDFVADICVKVFSDWAFNISSDYKLFIKAAYTNEPLSLHHNRLYSETLLKMIRLKEKLGNIGDSSSIDDISDVLFDIDDLDFEEDDDYENVEDSTDRFDDYDGDESDDNITDDDDLDDIKDTDEEKSENAYDEDTSS